MQDDVLRRLARLEESDDKMREALQQLIVSTARLNEIVEQHNYLIPTVRRLETQAMNNSLVVLAVCWSAVTCWGSAVTMTMGLFMVGLL